VPFAPCRARMRPSFSKDHRRRPCEHAHTPEELSARLFRCVRCQALALICSCCDHGQVYCSDSCAEEARRQSQREARRRYQESNKGRLAHAERQSRYREKLMAQPITPAPAEDAVAALAVDGCAPRPRDDHSWREARTADHPEQAKWRARRVHAEASDISCHKQIVTDHPSPPTPTDGFVALDAAGTRPSRCDWCGRPCSRSVRLTFLRRRRRRSGTRRANGHPT
jgi:hypothetical protein